MLEAEMTCVLLGPLAGKDRSWSVSEGGSGARRKDGDIPLINFLLAYFLKKASWIVGRAK